MEEKNKNSLKKAIDNLPKYSLKDNLWDKLSDNLDQSQSDTVLQEAIEQLPTYQAPEEAWVNIERQLPSIRRRMWPRVLAIAASLALLVGLFLNNNKDIFGPPNIEIVVQEKQVPADKFVNLVAFNNAQRDSAFSTIVRAQKESNEKAKLILAELEMLQDSKRRLSNKLGKFDTNKDLEEKLNRIEQESIELQQAFLATI